MTDHIWSSVGGEQGTRDQRPSSKSQQEGTWKKRGARARPEGHGDYREVDFIQRAVARHGRVLRREICEQMSASENSSLGIGTPGQGWWGNRLM